MFLVLDKETGEADFSLKPMNCPSHHLLYSSKKHSYRELPLRYNTYDVLHRNEVSGALSGLTRVRQTCSRQGRLPHLPDGEPDRRRGLKRLTQFILGYYATFGLTATLKFATRPAVRVCSDAMWVGGEGGVREALDATGLPYEMKKGRRRRILRTQGRLPDVMDSIGRHWQLGTIRAGLFAAGALRALLHGRGQSVRLHRPVLHPPRGAAARSSASSPSSSSISRSAFPVWLSPEQVRVLPHRRRSRRARRRGHGAASRRRDPRAT